MSGQRHSIQGFEVHRNIDRPEVAPMITINAEFLSQSPRKIRVEGSAIELLGLGDVSLGWMLDLPADVIAAALSKEGLLIVELLSGASLKSAQLLRNDTLVG